MPIATVAIVLVNVAIFAHEFALGTPGARDAFIDGYALVPYNVAHALWPAEAPVPALATLLTSTFLHAGISHLFFNMLFFIAFAPAIEALLGHARFVAFYLTCGVAGSVAQVSAHLGSHVPAIGASGAIAGVLGAYLVRYPTRRVFFGIPAVAFIGLWAAIQFVHGFGLVSTAVADHATGTAYFAHIGGLLCGIISFGIFTRRAPKSPGARKTMSYPRR